MENFKGTRITYETDGAKTVWECPNTDVTIEDVLWGFYGLCIGQTFYPSTVVRGMKEFAEEHSGDCTMNPESVEGYFNE